MNNECRGDRKRSDTRRKSAPKAAETCQQAGSLTLSVFNHIFIKSKSIIDLYFLSFIYVKCKIYLLKKKVIFN